MKQKIKNELLAEMGIIDEIAFENAYHDAKGQTKDEVKKAVKSVLIQLLEANAKAEHKTKGGRFGAIISGFFAKIVPSIKFNFNKK